MNWGISESLAAAYPNFTPVSRPVVEEVRIKDPN